MVLTHLDLLNGLAFDKFDRVIGKWRVIQIHFLDEILDEILSDTRDWLLVSLFWDGFNRFFGPVHNDVTLIDRKLVQICPLLERSPKKCILHIELALVCQDQISSSLIEIIQEHIEHVEFLIDGNGSVAESTNIVLVSYLAPIVEQYFLDVVRRLGMLMAIFFVPCAFFTLFWALLILVISYSSWDSGVDWFSLVRGEPLPCVNQVCLSLYVSLNLVVRDGTLFCLG